MAALLWRVVRGLHPFDEAVEPIHSRLEFADGCHVRFGGNFEAGEGVGCVHEQAAKVFVFQVRRRAQVVQRTLLTFPDSVLFSRVQTTGIAGSLMP